MEAAKINKSERIKKTFICEADQNKGELRKKMSEDSSHLLPCFPRRGKITPMLHVMLAQFKFMITVSNHVLLKDLLDLTSIYIFPKKIHNVAYCHIYNILL